MLGALLLLFPNQFFGQSQLSAPQLIMLTICFSKMWSIVLLPGLEMTPRQQPYMRQIQPQFLVYFIILRTKIKKKSTMLDENSCAYNCDLTFPNSNKEIAQEVILKQIIRWQPRPERVCVEICIPLTQTDASINNGFGIVSRCFVSR